MTRLRRRRLRRRRSRRHGPRRSPLPIILTRRHHLHLTHTLHRRHIRWWLLSRIDTCSALISTLSTSRDRLIALDAPALASLAPVLGLCVSPAGRRPSPRCALEVRCKVRPFLDPAHGCGYARVVRTSLLGLTQRWYTCRIGSDSYQSLARKIGFLRATEYGWIQMSSLACRPLESGWGET